MTRLGEQEVEAIAAARAAGAPEVIARARREAIGPEVLIWRARQARAAFLAGVLRSAAARLRVGVHAMLPGLVRWRLYRRTVTELSALDDALLRDVGVARDEIPALAWRLASEAVPRAAATGPALPVRPARAVARFG
jgi:uncharacterized protein YjiS (DUF1127 family)